MADWELTSPLTSMLAWPPGSNIPSFTASAVPAMVKLLLAPGALMPRAPAAMLPLVEMMLLSPPAKIPSPLVPETEPELETWLVPPETTIPKEPLTAPLLVMALDPLSALMPSLNDVT